MIIILVFMCFSIGIYALIKQEILITTKKKWKGKSTLFLSIPLIILGILLLAFVITRLMQLEFKEKSGVNFSMFSGEHDKWTEQFTQWLQYNKGGMGYF